MDIITMYLVFFFTCVGVDKNILKIKLAFICLFCPAHEFGHEFGHKFYNLYISLSAWPCGFHEVKNVTLFTENA